ncbi:MAG: hypothetical protein Q9202_006313 [Teloschistes flavicans]
MRSLQRPGTGVSVSPVEALETFGKLRQTMIKHGDMAMELFLQQNTQMQIIMSLLLAPNLNRLVLYVVGLGLADLMNRPCIWDTLTYIATSAPGLFLPNLRTVDISGTGVRPNHIAVLSLIPSVRTISMTSLDTDAFATNHVIETTPIQNLRFVPCEWLKPSSSINTLSMRRLLVSCCAHLTSIAIENARLFSVHYPDQCLFFVDLADVLLPVARTLRRLTFINADWTRDGSDKHHMLGSLAHFLKLEFLETHVDELAYPKTCPLSLRHIVLHPELFFKHEREIGCALSRCVIEGATMQYDVPDGGRVEELEFRCPLGAVGNEFFRNMVEVTLREAKGKGILVKAPDVVGGELVVEGGEVVEQG